MKNRRVLVAVAIASGALGSAHAQMTPKTEHGIPDAPTRIGNSSTSETGSLIKHELRWRSKIPLNKTYEQLNPEQLAELRKLYDKLPETDEPPFPLAGLKPAFLELKNGQHVLQARGELNLAVTVDANGNAIDVTDFGGVGGVNAHEMSEYAQSVFMMTKFKPGKCSGTPCTMKFPFRISLK